MSDINGEGDIRYYALGWNPYDDPWSPPEDLICYLEGKGPPVSTAWPAATRRTPPEGAQFFLLHQIGCRATGVVGLGVVPDTPYPSPSPGARAGARVLVDIGFVALVRPPDIGVLSLRMESILALRPGMRLPKLIDGWHEVGKEDFEALLDLWVAWSRLYQKGLLVGTDAAGEQVLLKAAAAQEQARQLELTDEALRNRVLDAFPRVCSSCGVRLQEVYGAIGQEAWVPFFRRVPEYDEEEQPIYDLHRDLALVCGSCHRILHSRTPALTLDELRAVLQKK